MTEAGSETLIIGGGIVGCAVALALADRNAPVRLLDRDQPGVGATGASAGMLAPQYESEAGSAAFRFGIQSRAAWPGFVRRLEELSDWPVGYRKSGMLVANRTVEEEEGARSAVAWQREALQEASVVDPAHAGELHSWVSREMRSYLWLPAEAQVDAQRVAVALGDAVRGAGVTLQLGRGVKEILSWNGKVEGIRLDDGETLGARRVVLAAGAWSPRVQGLPRELPLRPVRGQILRLLPDDPSPWPLVADHQGHYLVPRENGTVLMGSTMEEVGYDDSVTQEGRTLLAERAAELVPPLADARVVESWAGLRPITADRLPVLGPDPKMEGLFHATGHGRNGILFAPLTGRILADLILDGESSVEWDAFSVRRLDAR